MQNRKIKVCTIFAWIFGGLCLAALIAWLALFFVAECNLFAIRPVWLGFLLMTAAGVSMMTACVFIYVIMLMKERERNTFLCPSCGKVCDVDNRFCPHCGEGLQEIE